MKKLNVMLTWLSAAALVAALAMMSETVNAHHSFSMFDPEKRVTLEGVVTDFQWKNPHVFIELDVPQEQGAPKHYSIECAGPFVLRGLGWNRHLLKTGDKITVEIMLLRDGRQGGMLNQVTLGDGKKLGAGL